MLDLDQEFESVSSEQSSQAAAVAVSPASAEQEADTAQPGQEQPAGAAPDQPRSARSQAESEYQRIPNEILDSTREVCQKLIEDGEKALERAKFLEAESEQKRQEAQQELEAAKALRAEAEGFREKAVAAVTEAQQQSQEILDQARAAKESQAAEYKQQASEEAQRILAEAEAARTAARDELEAQRLYTEAARLKSESSDVLGRLRQQVNGLLTSTVSSASPVTPVAGASQSRPAPAVQVKPAAQDVQDDVDESSPVEEPLNPAEPAAVAESQSPSPVAEALSQQPVVPGAAGEPQADPTAEDPTLSRKKAGRWFGFAD
ncbi:MAG: hypothetical protein FJ316_08295 [SAR202 cluster bacterium]|nr:hypothetical protein [SAR202 cluster bacterium]